MVECNTMQASCARSTARHQMPWRPQWEYDAKCGRKQDRDTGYPLWSVLNRKYELAKRSVESKAGSLCRLNRRVYDVTPRRDRPSATEMLESSRQYLALGRNPQCNNMPIIGLCYRHFATTEPRSTHAMVSGAPSIPVAHINSFDALACTISLSVKATSVLTIASPNVYLQRCLMERYSEADPGLPCEVHLVNMHTMRLGTRIHGHWTSDK
ncbi:hypothetical protein CTAM01_07837 [Colletotrichum tamarilloi]|uniref:Uncharacterized protein n=1 Tax=Colletotrichum tamarilloi TaxID=1209934 RepID=A0ABQ9R8R2_9PEZI|nr:uncharacterized protein CTAM01_07837 [Colletotrichum tamarilloi]KAK1497567.1 hypothetical protein CTAM01_07837 [Colletotrichum tamarilloi]